MATCKYDFISVHNLDTDHPSCIVSKEIDYEQLAHVDCELDYLVELFKQEIGSLTTQYVELIAIIDYEEKTTYLVNIDFTCGF